MYALKREHEGKRFFEQNAGRFSHAAVVEAFQRLAREEEQHICFIQSLLASLDAADPSDVEDEQALEAGDLFSRRAADALLDQTIIEWMVPDLSVLHTAYLIERDSAESYGMAAQRAEDEMAREALDMLAERERGHERLIKQMYGRAFEEYAGKPWGG